MKDYAPKSNPVAPEFDRTEDRERIQSDMDKFIAGGGEVEKVDYLFTAGKSMKKYGYNTTL